MIDPEKFAKDFWENGFALAPGVFPKSTMDKLDALTVAHFGDRPDFEHTDEFLSKSQTEVVPWFPQREGERAFDEIEADNLFSKLTSAVLGQAWERQYCMVMFSKAGTVGQAWHQDCPSDGGHFNLNRLVYTADIDPEIGGQVVVRPGSHRLGELPAGDPHETLAEELVLAPKAGDLLFLHGYCWHRVLPVHTKFRSSVNYRAATEGAPENLTDICVYRNMRYQFSTQQVIETRHAP